MLSRRQVLQATAIFAGGYSALAGAKPLGTRLYRLNDSPDEIGRRILSNYIDRLDHGTAAGDNPAPAIHRNFPQLIEQNFARFFPDAMERALTALAPMELSALESIYANACHDSGHVPQLYALMASRLDARILAQLSWHFDSEALHSAVATVAPGKVSEFIGLRAELAALGGPASASAAGSSRPAIIAPSANSSSFLDYTLNEIYLSYRTAPVGSLSVRAALYETTMFAGKRLVGAWGAGHAFGTYVLAPLIQTYAPGLWDNIGSAVNTAVEAIHSAIDIVTVATVQRNTGHVFDLSLSVLDQLALGGDYGVTWEWYEVFTLPVHSPCWQAWCEGPEHPQ